MSLTSTERDELIAAARLWADTDPDHATAAQLRKLLSGHLCRCTGYENILRAVKKTMLKRLGKSE